MIVPQLSANPHFVWWLVPCAPLKLVLQGTINTLCSEHDAVEFEPHITLAPPSRVNLVDDVPRMIQNLEPIAISNSQMRLGTGERFTQSVFLRFDEDIADLNELRNQLLEAQQMESNEADKFPHLSLIYKAFADDADRQELVKSLTVDQLGGGKGPMVFDTLQVMALDLPIETNDDVRKWKCVQSYSLGKECKATIESPL